jgi:hypothetical protein
MAQRMITQLVDDIDGTQITDGKGETVTFAIDGVTYEIDLTDANAKKLRDALQFYSDSARRVSGRSGGTRATGGRRATGGGTSSAKRDPSRTKAIKEWASANGHKVAERGRISQTVIGAYEAAH